MERGRGGIKTNVKCVFRTTETDLKKLSLKSKLASGPHESKEDPQKQPQEEKYRRSTGRGACQPAAAWSEFSLLRCCVEFGNLGGSVKPILLSASISPSPYPSKSTRCLVFTGGHFELTSSLLRQAHKRSFSSATPQI